MDPLQILDIAFLAMLLAVAFAIVRINSMFAVVMLTGVYSLLSAAWFVVLDAVDVAFTEAAVGAAPEDPTANRRFQLHARPLARDRLVALRPP